VPTVTPRRRALRDIAIPYFRAQRIALLPSNANACRCLMKIHIALIAASTLVAGCSSVSYRPVQEVGFEQLSSEGCRRAGDRFSVTALVNSATREAIVLWDGTDGARTVVITLPSAGVGSRVKGVFGKNRYELGHERLNALRASATPANFTMRCEGTRMAPVADRFSYVDNGTRVEFEF
jgi:hypothetical protein